MGWAMIGNPHARLHCQDRLVSESLVSNGVRCFSLDSGKIKFH